MSGGEWMICGVCDGRTGFESIDDVGEPIWITCSACSGTGQIWLNVEVAEDDELEVPESDPPEDDYWR